MVIKVGAVNNFKVRGLYPSGSYPSIVYVSDEPTATVYVVSVKLESKIGRLFITFKMKHNV